MIVGTKNGPLSLVGADVVKFTILYVVQFVNFTKKLEVHSISNKDRTPIFVFRPTIKDQGIPRPTKAQLVSITSTSSTSP